MAWNEKPLLKLYRYENDSFHLNAVIDDYESVSFERNYYEAGTFTVTINLNIPNALRFKRGIFIQFGNDPYDFGEITSISDSMDESGKGGQMRQITGYDGRYIFHKRIIRNLNTSSDWSMTSKGEIVMRNLIYDQCGNGAEEKRRLPVVNIIPDYEDSLGSEYTCTESYSNLYDTLVTIATQSETGWRIMFNGNSLNLEFYSGSDLSGTVKFSDEFNSVRDGNVSDSSESYANTIYVGGKGSGDERDVYEGEIQDSNGNVPSGMDRYEAWDDESDMNTTSEYETQAESMLSQYGQTVEVSANGLAKSPYIYKTNYDVGDIVQVTINDITANVRILSVTENWSKGSYGIDFSVGKPMNTLNRQMNLMLTQIRKASTSTSTDSIMWYTIPDDTEMASADVNYKTIGFIGECGENGSTFKLYLDNEGTGAKSYHVYFKQLGGGTLTLTTGVSGASNLVMSSGTYVAIVYVDEDGNVKSQTSLSSQTAIKAGTASATTTETAETESGSNEVSINIDGFTSDDLVSGKTVKVIVPQLDTGSPTLNINSLGAYPIKAVRNGGLISPVAHTGYWGGASSTSSRVWDNNTTLELIFNGSAWVICGNPVFNSYFSTDKGYTVYSNGKIEQWGYLYKGSLSPGSSWGFSVDLLVQMTDDGYYIGVSAGSSTSAGQEERYDSGQTVTGFAGHYYNRNSGTTISGASIRWEVKGY